MPQSLAAAITLIALLGFITTLVAVIVPVVSRELVLISSINPELFTNEIQNWLSSLEHFLVDYGMLDSTEHLSTILVDQFSTILKSIDIQYLAGNIFSFATSLFIAVFAVTFLTFYSLSINIDFSSRKAKELLALLVARRGGIVEMEFAVDLLWEEEPFSEQQQCRRHS